MMKRTLKLLKVIASVFMVLLLSGGVLNVYPWVRQNCLVKMLARLVAQNEVVQKALSK